MRPQYCTRFVTSVTLVLLLLHACLFSDRLAIHSACHLDLMLRTASDCPCAYSVQVQEMPVSCVRVRHDVSTNHRARAHHEWTESNFEKIHPWAFLKDEVKSNTRSALGSLELPLVYKFAVAVWHHKAL